MAGKDRFRAQGAVRPAWRRFIDEIEPLRPELFRYCCGLVGNVWDGEDLVQDVLARVFALMGRTNADFERPRAYLIRAATHLWFDRLRSRRRERAQADALAGEAIVEQQVEVVPADPVGLRTAAATLFAVLPPRERAAVLLIDVLDLTPKETASVMKTTEGAVKSALHRGRARLASPADPAPQERCAIPRPIVERFAAALSERRLDELRALCLEEVTIDMVGGARFESFDQGRRVFEFAHLSIPGLGMGGRPRWVVLDYHGEAIVVGLRTKGGVEGVNEIWRVEPAGDRLGLVRLYCFTPDLLSMVAAEIDLPALKRPYRSPM